MTLGEIIKELRKENNLSQEELAEQLGISRQSVSLWEKDTTQPTLDNIVTLSDIFHISVDDLLKSNTVPSVSSAEEAAPEDGTEVLSENGTAPQEKELRSQKIKRILIPVFDLAVFIFTVWLAYFYHDSTDEYSGVIVTALDSSAMFLMMRCVCYFAALSVLWVIVCLVSFLKKKRQRVMKTILLTLLVVLVVASNVQIARFQLNIDKNADYFDEIPQGVSYVNLKDFVTVDTSSAYSEGYGISGTNEKVTANYQVSQDYLDASAETFCVTFSDDDLVNDYYEEQEGYRDTDWAEQADFTDAQAKELGITKGWYVYNLYDKHNDIRATFIKNKSVYHIEIIGKNSIDEDLTREIQMLK